MKYKDEFSLEAIEKKRRPRNNDMPEIVFDNQPLDSVLYRQPEGGKASASLYGRARTFVN